MRGSIVSGLMLFIAILFSITGSTTCFAQTVLHQWVGDYSYRYVMAHAPGALAAAWSFNLTVKRDGSCELTWQGYQKDDDMLCKVSGDKKELRVFYSRSANASPSGNPPVQ